MTSVVAIVGQGGQGRVVLDALLVGGHNVTAVLDAPTEMAEVGGVPVLGTPESWRDHAGEGVAFVVALGDAARRRALAEEIVAGGGTVASAIHPRATVSPRARLGRGVILLAGSVVGPDASVGDFSILNVNAAIDHDCRLGVAVQLGPGVTFPGGVVVGDGAFIGAGATVVPGRRIGRGAVVGAGAVVTKDVPDGVTVVGNPARPLQTPG